MKSLLNWLSTPYYFNPTIKFKFKVSLVFGLFVFFFLYVFKPFYLSLLNDIILEYTIGISIISFFGVFIMLYVPPLIFKDYFNEDNWTLGRNYFLIFLGLFLIGSSIWYCGTFYKSNYDIESISLLSFLYYTFLVGAIPILFFVFLNEKEIREKREKKAINLNTLKKERLSNKNKVLKKEITIYSENNKESINFKIENLIYISSQGNYASFFLNEKEGYLKEIILRITLAKIDAKLNDYDYVIRCHKSYIINTKCIQGIHGNARGYLLQSDIIPFKIPVSRSYSKQSLSSLIDNN
jgi:hypothetical protein